MPERDETPVTLTADEVRVLREFLATEADEARSDDERHTALLQLCGFLASALNDRH